jgi:hypothetical protein
MACSPDSPDPQCAVQSGIYSGAGRDDKMPAMQRSPRIPAGIMAGKRARGLRAVPCDSSVLNLKFA